MGLTKQYLRFASDGVFGVVASKTCNAAYLPKRPYRFVVTGGANIINLWDTKFQRRVRTLHCDSPAVVVEPSPSGNKLVVGHFNGSVSIYDLSDLSEEASPDPDVVFEGHTSEITCLAWDSSESQVASGSKDTKVIVWDVVSETGFGKFTAHKGVITRVRFWEHEDEQYLVSSSFDTTVRIWNMATKLNVHTIPCTIQIRDFEIHRDIFVIAEANLKLFKVTHSSDTVEPWVADELGTLLRQAHDRPSRIYSIEETGVMLVVGVKSPVIEGFRFSTEEQAVKRKNKRLKKDPEGDANFVLKDLVRRGETLKASEDKIKSISGVCEKGILKVLCCLPSNQLEVLTFSEKEDHGRKAETVCFESSLLPFDGHRKLVRGISFSSDKTAVLTASGDSFKVWNRTMLNCILTIPHEYPVVCCQFCPGDRHFISGSTDGHLILADISTGTITQVEPTGNETIWSIDVFNNNMGFAASNGNLVQLYDFLMADGKLQFQLKRQLDVQDSVLCCKVTNNMKFLAVGLLDSTIKIFYLDTLKFHLSMYGHTLPIVSIDISYDNNFLISCSGDKTVKLWGMDFGDCHCSLIHTDGLVGCSFVDKTHLMVSIAKDSLNIYDADSHTRVQTIKAHIGGGATCMSSKGFFIASAGRDQTLRLYKRTQEILVLDDEREQEREEELDKDAKSEDPDLVTLTTAEGEKWADKVIEAMDIYKDPINSKENPLLAAYQAKDPKDFLYKSLSQIKAAELQQSLMMLPINYVQDFVPALQSILESYPLSVELVVRCLAALVKFHLVTIKGMDKNVLTSIADLTTSRLNNLERTILVNKTALEFLYDAECEKEQEQMFRELSGERKRKRKKKEKAIKRAILLV